jgi:hypothetical protein
MQTSDDMSETSRQILDRVISLVEFVLSRASKPRPFSKLRAGSGAPIFVRAQAVRDRAERIKTAQ